MTDSSQTLSQKKLTVLMLDHEPLMIDRRIILEGQTLVAQGYRVILATRGDGIQPQSGLERGIEVRRFVDPYMDDVQSNAASISRPSASKTREQQLSIDRQKIQGWIYSPGNSGIEKWMKSVFFFLPRKIQSFLYAIAWPPIMAARLRRVVFFKRILGKAFEPAIYIMMLRPNFLMPYFRLFANRLFRSSTSSLFQNKETERNESSKETWLTRLEKFALELDPDIVHAHDLPNLAVAHRIVTVLGARLIYDAHELYPMQYFSDEGQRKNLSDLEARLIGHADAVISINSQCVDVLESTYSIKDVVPLTNATESPIGFDPSMRLRMWHERFNLDDDVKIMVFQGGINPVRNIDQLIHALANLPDYIHMGFITYAKDIPYYEELTQRLGIFHRIHYIIEIPWDEVILWLASADVGIMPYQVTNFNAQIASPNKLYEFVVAGLPIIGSTELVNVKRAIDEDGIGLGILLREPDSYCTIIRQMFEHPGGCERFRNNVLAVRHRYLWTNEEPKLIDLYKRIIDPEYQPKACLNKKMPGVACAE